jgi:hypothetical protein
MLEEIDVVSLTPELRVLLGEDEGDVVSGSHTHLLTKEPESSEYRFSSS